MDDRLRIFSFMSFLDFIPEPVYSGNPQYVSIYLVRVDDKWKVYDMQ